MKDNEIPQDDLPYTIVGSSAMNKPVLSVLLTAAGVKELAKRTGDNDLVRITMWEDVENRGEISRHYQEITIIDRSKRAE